MTVSQNNVVGSHCIEFNSSLISCISDHLNGTINDSSIPSPELNASLSSEHPPGMGAFKSTIIVLYVIVCFFGIATNGLVVYVLVISARLERVTNIYILNLAIADLLFLLGIPFTVVTAIESMWIFGEIMCKVSLSLYIIIVLYSSICIAPLNSHGQQ